jgi:hypothetical protein
VWVALLLALTLVVGDESVHQLGEMDEVQKDADGGEVQKAAEQKAHEAGLKAKKKASDKKKATAVEEAAEKAKNRQKQYSEASVKESQLKKEEKEKRTHYQNLFRLGMRFKHLLSQFEKETDKEKAALLKEQLHKIEKIVPRSYVKNDEEGMPAHPEKDEAAEEEAKNDNSKDDGNKEKEPEKEAETEEEVEKEAEKQGFQPPVKEFEKEAAKDDAKAETNDAEKPEQKEKKDAENKP